MCKKCEILHSKLLKNHEIINLDKSKDDIIFTGLCNAENHKVKLEYFCKTHNQLCCAACISKIKKNEDGKHKDCEICLIEEIKEEKIKVLKGNIKILEDLSETIEKSINDMKKKFEKIQENKEKLKSKCIYDYKK